MARAAHNRAASTMFNETEFAQFALPFFAKALGLSEDEIKEKSTTTDGQAELQSLYGTKRKEAKSEGYKEAEGKLQKALNKSAKDLFGVETDAKDVIAAVTAIKENYQSSPDANPQELTEKAVKQHPLYLRMELAKSDAETALANRNAEFEKAVEEKVSGKVSTLTLQQRGQNGLPELKAIMPTHKGQRESLVKQYLDSFANIVEKTVEGKTYYYDKDGNRQEDTMGAPLDWDSLLRRQAEQYFELEGPERDSPAARPQGGQQPAGGGQRVDLSPKTQEELSKVLANPSVSSEDRSKAFDFYKKNATDAAG